MSTDKPSGGLESTRQMLDDLDALMERMLALPMDDADASVSAPAMQAKRPALAATLTMLPPIEEELASKTTSPLQGPHASFSTPEAIRTPLVEEPADDGELRILPPLTIRRLHTVVTPEELPPMPARSFFLWRPLRVINRGYDQATRLLGPLGCLLRSSPARFLLGFAGLALLSLAAAWFIRDLMTW